MKEKSKVVEVAITYQMPNGEVTRYRLNGEEAERWAKAIETFPKRENVPFEWKEDRIVWFGA
jgi:hypothetical protein